MKIKNILYVTFVSSFFGNIIAMNQPEQPAVEIPEFIRTLVPDKIDKIKAIIKGYCLLRFGEAIMVINTDPKRVLLDSIVKEGFSLQEAVLLVNTYVFDVFFNYLKKRFLNTLHRNPDLKHWEVCLILSRCKPGEGELKLLAAYDAVLNDLEVKPLYTNEDFIKSVNR